jgi:hypothetical protein
MKPNVNQTSLESKGVQDSVKFGIKNTGLAHIFNVLRNQLYSDKITAVVREYSCNAVDAHVEQGIGDRPIEVTLPSKLKLEFKVRDFGPALNDEEIHDVYAFYGESTKRNTNEQTGMLGIGSKSAFAYGDNFVINSYIDGEKHIWNAFIDPSQVGQISKIGTEKTEEENGIEIVLPVKEDDTQEFVEKAEGLFRYFKVTPTIKGATQFEYSKKKVLFEGDNWVWYRAEGDRWSYRHENAMAVMGNIAYPFQYDDLNFSDEERQEDLHNLVKGNLHLKCDIGELDISASREKLQFTDATRKTIIAKLRVVKDGIVSQAEKQFANSPSLWAAKQLLGDVRDYASGLYELRTLIEANVKWRGKLIDSCGVSTPKGVTSTLLKKPDRSGAVRYRFEDGWNQIQAEARVVIVENDLGNRRGIIGRLLGMAMEEKKKVHLIEFEDAKARKAWLKVFDGEMLKLSELDKRPLSDFYGSSTSSTTTTDSKHAKKLASPAFEFDWSQQKSSGWSYKASDYWKAAKVDLENDEGVYVIIDKFKVEGQSGYGNSEPRRIANFKKKFEKLGLNFPKNVYAWKIAKQEKPKAAKGWVELFDWMKQEIQNYLIKNNLEQKFVDFQHACDNDGDLMNARVRNGLKEKNFASDDSLVLIGIKKFEKMFGTEKDRDDMLAFRELLDRFNLELKLDSKPSYDLENWKEKVMKKYSMLNVINWYDVNTYQDSARKSNLKHLMNYINVVDVCDASR